MLSHSTGRGTVPFSRNVLLALVVWASVDVARVVGSPDTPLKSCDLENRLQAVNLLVSGHEHQRPLEAPWTGERLDAFLKARGVSLSQVLAESPSVSFEQLAHYNIATLARLRLALTVEQPRRDRWEDFVIWIDSHITQQQLLLLAVSRAVESTRRYVDFKRAHLLPMDEVQDQQLVEILGRLEGLLRERLAVTVVRSLLQHADKTPARADRQLIENRLSVARRALPPDFRDADDGKLNVYKDGLSQEIAKSAHALWVAVASAYVDLVVRQHKTITAKESLIKDHGRPGAERRDLERLRAHAMTAICSWAHYQGSCHIESLRLCVLRNHCDRQYGGTAAKVADSLTLPAAYDALEKYYDESIAATIRILRNCLDTLEKQVDQGEGVLVSTLDWLLIRGPDVASPLADAVIDDLTQWMSDLPATRRTVKQQILDAAGFPQGKQRIGELTEGEQDQVTRQMLKTYKELRQEFDRDPFYRMRQNLELLEALVASYPPRGLLGVVKASWPEEPKSRLTMADCRDLDNAAAARAYNRLFEQLTKDWEALSAEHAEYLVKLNLKVTYYHRAAAAHHP